LLPWLQLLLAQAQQATQLAAQQTQQRRRRLAHCIRCSGMPAFSHLAAHLAQASVTSMQRPSMSASSTSLGWD
jgi:hypothetical protein